MTSYSESELSDALKAWKYQKTLIKSDFMKNHIDKKRDMNNPPVVMKDLHQLRRCDECGDRLDEGQYGKCPYCKNHQNSKPDKRPPSLPVASKHKTPKRLKKMQPKCSICKQGLSEGEYGQCFYCKRLAEGY